MSEEKYSQNEPKKAPCTPTKSQNIILKKGNSKSIVKQIISDFDSPAPSIRTIKNDHELNSKSPYKNEQKIYEDD